MIRWGSGTRGPYPASDGADAGPDCAAATADVAPPAETSERNPANPRAVALANPRNWRRVWLRDGMPPHHAADGSYRAREAQRAGLIWLHARCGPSQLSPVTARRGVWGGGAGAGHASATGRRLQSPAPRRRRTATTS